MSLKKTFQITPPPKRHLTPLSSTDVHCNFNCFPDFVRCTLMGNQPWPQFKNGIQERLMSLKKTFQITPPPPFVRCTLIGNQPWPQFKNGNRERLMSLKKTFQITPPPKHHLTPLSSTDAHCNFNFFPGYCPIKDLLGTNSSGGGVSQIPA